MLPNVSSGKENVHRVADLTLQNEAYNLFSELAILLGPRALDSKACEYHLCIWQGKQMKLVLCYHCSITLTNYRF